MEAETLLYDGFRASIRS